MTGKTIYVCNGHLCGNIGESKGKCGCCPDGVMIRYVEAQTSTLKGRLATR